MNSKRTKILLVDDHNLVRKALGVLISSFSSRKFEISEGASGRDALAMLERKSIDLLLLDIQMPEMGGVETMKEIRHRGMNTKIIILTQFENEDLLLHLLKLGANGFMLKACDPQELEKAIIAVLEEGHYYDARVLKAIERSLSHEEELSSLDISPREFQVLVLLKEGRSNKEIAQGLGLTLNTIESYRKRLIKKTKSRNTVDLVSLAYRTGLLPQ